MPDRELDVVVFGATGVTGRQVAAYLAGRAADGTIAWAAAARDSERAQRVLAELGVEAPAILQADVGDALSLARLAARARVVLNLVGPYARYATPVIEACVDQGTHYVDLTGEIPFVRDVLDAFDERARVAGVKVVQVCGFEALPPDMLVRLAARSAVQRWDEALEEADIEVSAHPPPGPPHASDMISGGTFQSVALLTGATNSAAAVDPAALIEDDALAAEVRAVSPIALAPRAGENGAVVAPMAPAPFINPAVIHRSEHLAARAEGRPPRAFRYREGLALGGGPVTAPLRWGAAGALSATQYGLRALAKAGPELRRPLARGLARFGPASGFGPAPARMERWSWRMSVRSRTAGGHVVRADVSADGHPGYLSTARMVGEAGVLLSREGLTPPLAGCLTPAIALGTDAAPHFAAARARFSVDA